MNLWKKKVKLEVPKNRQVLREPEIDLPSICEGLDEPRIVRESRKLGMDLPFSYKGWDKSDR